MSNLGNHTFTHHCQSCGKDMSPILTDLRLVRFDNKIYEICEDCYQIGCRNGVISEENNQFNMKKGDFFPTGFGTYQIVEIKDDTIYAIRKGHTYNSLEDFNILQFTRHEVENYIKYQ